MKYLIAALACAFSSVVLAAPPPAPQISVAATDIRQLEFSWEPVRGAQRYELWFQSAPRAQWVKYTEQPAQRAPLFRIGVPVHLLDWRQARYYVKACSTAGCTPSNTVSVDGEQLAAMGFIKPRGPINHHYFGSNVAASADGKTFAVLSSETLGSTGITATVHVYRKTTSSSGWRREARLVPSVIQPGTGQPILGDPIAISGDGNLVVLGAWTEHELDGSGKGAAENGAVYLFRRNGTAWTQTQRITWTKQPGDRFGYVVKVDDAGRTLVVEHSHVGTDSRPGTLEVYRDAENDGSDQFAHSASVPTAPASDGEQLPFCAGIALSGNGQTLLRACHTSDPPTGYVQVLNAPDWSESASLSSSPTWGVDISFDGTTALVQDEISADAWKLGPGGWTLEHRLDNGSGIPNFQRRHIALSRDGKIAVLGNSAENSAGVGPVYPPYEFDEEHDATGGAIVWERKPSGWVLRRLVKPGSTHWGRAGHSVALGDNGRLLIVGAPFDPSAATGIDGDRDDDSAPERGAVWVY